MLTNQRIPFRRFIGPLVTIFGAVCHPPNLDAKALLNGHIVEVRPDGLLLQMRFYSIAVHTTGDTKVRCQKQSLSFTDLEVQDLVTVEGQRPSREHCGNESHYPPRLATMPGNQRFKTMSLQMLKHASKSVGPTVVSVFFAALTLWGQSPLVGEKSSLMQEQASSSGHQVVVVLDINPHQEKVLPVELALAEGTIQRLHQAENTFSVITFGSQTPTLLKPGVTADEAIAMIRDVTLEQTREKYFSVHFYDALSLAISQFTDNTRSKSLLVISEGNDYFPRKTFKETVARAQQLQAACDVAMVADHTLYGTKGIQRYGFHLRRLAGKTHGQYMEVGAKQKRVPRSVERLSDAILNQ